MFRVPDYYHNVSLGLSKVLYDIGVNEEMVLKRRRMKLLHETMETAVSRILDKPETWYVLGSHSEGTTTRGINSDVDVLACSDNVTVLQDLNEWSPGVCNLLMIQNDSTPPGYCLLQQLRPDVPLPQLVELDNDWVRDTHGKILLKNTILDSAEIGGAERHGPSWAIPGISGKLDKDMVFALCCTSWPKVARKWLVYHESEAWPTAEMKRYARNSKCFVVGGTSKISEVEDFEWRISTSLAERCLMFNLNITQIRCYILMKMFIKTHLTYHGENYISSYMCKTVLLHSIKMQNPNIWKECNILSCLTYCLLTLHRCISERNCPHFIITENNLMAGKFSLRIKTYFLDSVMKVVQCNRCALLSIKTDNLGQRLHLELNMTRHANFLTSGQEILHTAGSFMRDTALTLITVHFLTLSYKKNETSEIQIKFLVKILRGLARFYRDGNLLERAAFRLLTPLFCTSFGSLIASYNIQINNSVSSQAVAWLLSGLNSDVSSSRLKLATVFYCTGDIERTLCFLRDTKERYKMEFVEPICPCDVYGKPRIKTTFTEVSRRHNEEALRYIVAFCVRFSPCETLCTPYECRYEMFRSTTEELRNRSEDDDWMDCAVIDSLPYLYFLQYKTFTNLQKDEEKQQALYNLRQVTLLEDNLSHRETALNILGQCMEQENRYEEAFQCYVISLRLRTRNNAARIHICRLLANALAK